MTILSIHMQSEEGLSLLERRRGKWRSFCASLGEGRAGSFQCLPQIHHWSNIQYIGSEVSDDIKLWDWVSFGLTSFGKIEWCTVFWKTQQKWSALSTEILEVYSQKKPSCQFPSWCVFCCAGPWRFILSKVRITRIRIISNNKDVNSLKWHLAFQCHLSKVRCGGLRASVIVFWLSSLGLSPGWGYCVVFLGKTLNSHRGLSPPRLAYNICILNGLECGLGKVMRSLKVPNHEILGVHYLSLDEKVSFSSCPKAPGPF